MRWRKTRNQPVYLLVSADGTISGVVNQFVNGYRWHWEISQYEDASGAVRVAYAGGRADTRQAAQAAVEQWITQREAQED